MESITCVFSQASCDRETIALSLARPEGARLMDKTYWIGRQAAASAMARGASSAKVRLIHYELAGRYSVKAAQCPAFMLPEPAPATLETRTALHLPAPPAFR
jgi:hypothetical protein